MDIKAIEETVSRVSKELGWAVDKRISIAVVNLYMSRDRDFDAKLHQESSKIIKAQEGWTSPLRSHMYHIASAFLTLDEQDSETALKTLNDHQKQLNEAGFRKTAYTYLAALLMQDKEDALRAKELYNEMKEHHKFLTSNEDIPYAVLLGRQAGEPQERAETMNHYYKELRGHGFNMGNDLQWLSQVMTFNSHQYDQKMIGRVLAILEFFKQEKIKIRAAQYPVLGFLAVTEADGHDLKAIAEGTRSLERTKIFKWYKDAAFSTAVQAAMKDMAETRDLSAMTFSVSLETLMQAQQAAMMVSTNAAIIASQNSSAN